MAGGKKKKQRNLFLLLALLVLVVAAYFGTAFLMKDKEGENTGEDDTEVVLVALDGSLAEKITYQSQKGAMTLVLDGETWKKEGEEEFPVNQTYAAAMRNALYSVKAGKTIMETAENLEEFGLKDPALVATLTLSDGNSATVRLGSTSPDGSGNYAMVDGMEGIYLVSTSLSDRFDYTDSQMIAKEEIPKITTDNITRILIEKPGGVGNFELLDDYTNEFDQTGGYNSWVLEQGYPVRLLASGDAVTPLLANYGTYVLVDCLEYACSDFAEYGLAEPQAKLTIEYFDAVEKKVEEDVNGDGEMESVTEYDKIEHDFGISIGDRDGEGNYYVRLNGSDAVYTMAEAGVTKLLDVNAPDFVSKTPAIINIAGVDGIEVTMEGETHTVSLSRDSEEDKTEITKYVVDGKEYVKDEFTPLYQALIGTKIEGDIKSEVAETASNDPVMTIAFQRVSFGKEDFVVRYLPYDDNFYRMEVEGSSMFIVSKRAINTLMDTVKNFGSAPDAAADGEDGAKIQD